MARKASGQAVPVGDTDPFRPTARRPVRVRARALPADAHFEPHRHPWSQLAYCATGIVQVTVAMPDEVTYIVPPSRAVWIAPGARHAVTVLEAAEFRTLYMHPTVTPAGWTGCRMLVVSPLLRELIQSLDAPADTPAAREALLGNLALDEIARAATQPLGVPMPAAQGGDKRLLALCEAVLRDPSRQETLGQLAAQAGASERTMARLFQAELGMGYQQWRNQATLAHALPLLARGVAVGHVAAACGYGSESAFSAMFRGAMGQRPREFQKQKRPRSAPALDSLLQKQ